MTGQQRKGQRGWMSGQVYKVGRYIRGVHTYLSDMRYFWCLYLLPPTSYTSPLLSLAQEVTRWA